MITPRPYQIEALESILDRRSQGISRQVVCLPTGCGKTVLFSLLAKELNCRTLIIAHREELLIQAKDKLKLIWPDVDTGIVRAGIDEVDAQVVIASIQTVCRNKRLQKLMENEFKLLIVDEAHHAAAESYKKVILELGFMDNDPDKLLVGVTATPKRGDGLGLGLVFEEIVFDRSIGTMVRAGYLSNLVGKQIFTKIALKNIGIQNGDFNQSQLSKIVNVDSRNQLIVQNYTQHAKGRSKSLVFAVDVKHAQDLAMAFNAHGISSKAVYGSMDKVERKEILKDFSDGKIQVLTNCQILTEGFDEPSIDCVVMARPTKSSTLYTQMVGRGTRTYPAKKNCLILDFADNSRRHDLCNFKNSLDGVVATLFDPEWRDDVDEGDHMDEREISANKRLNDPSVQLDRVEDIQFFDSAAFAWNKVGDSWHLILGSNRDVWLRQVDSGFLIVAQSNGHVVNLSNRALPLDYALGVAEDWSRKQTTKNAWARKDATWRSQPPTQKQLDALAKSGFSFDHGMTRGRASELLDSKLNDPATSKQIYCLKINRIPFQHGITKVEASRLIASQKKFA